MFFAITSLKIRFFLLVLLIIPLWLQSSYGQQATRTRAITRPAATRPAVERVTPAANNRYRIGPGDVLEIRVYKLPDLSRESLRVEESGTIRMPLIKEDIPAACRTEGELADYIAARYLTYMRNPQVDVFVKEYNSAPVAVIGAVTSPGRFQLQRRIRLLELLSLAGGPTERAGGNIQLVRSTHTFRCEAQEPQSRALTATGLHLLDLNETLRGDERSNPYVRAGDVITILEAPQVHVVGNVVKPVSLPMKERITVSQAIAMAGGTLPDSQSDRIRIIRQNRRQNTRQEMIVNLRAITKLQARDVELLPNDIVEVPTASGKRFLRKLLGESVPSAARLPLYVVR